MKRKLRRVAIVLVVFAGVFVALNLILTAIWSRQIDRELAKLRARGEPVTVADLVPKQVPDEQNAAPIYEKALALLSSEDRSYLSQYLTEYSDDDERVELESKNGALKAKQDEIISIIDDAVARSHYVDPELQTPDNFYLQGLAHGKLLRICKFLAASAVMNARDGNTSDAIDAIVLGLRVAQPQDSYIAAPCGNIDVMLLALRKVVQRSDVASRDAELVCRELGKFDFESEALRRFRSDRVLANAFFGNVRHDLSSIICIDYAPPREGLEPGDRLLYRTLGFFWRPLLCKGHLYYLNASAKELDMLHKSYRMLPKGKNKSPLGTPYADYWLNGNDLQKLRDLHKAQIGLAQTTLALKTYKNRLGTYPATLGELKTYPAWKLPDDPFSGKPFGYKKIGQGFRVWSWGDDLVDDGGRLDKEIYGPGTGGREDIVWIVEK